MHSDFKPVDIVLTRRCQWSLFFHFSRASTRAAANDARRVQHEQSLRNELNVMAVDGLMSTIDGSATTDAVTASFAAAQQQTGADSLEPAVDQQSINAIEQVRAEGVCMASINKTVF